MFNMMLSQASLKLQRPGYCRASSMPSHEGSLALKLIVGLKGDLVRKTVVISKNSNQLERKLGSFFF